jgi:hypothetical protein
MKIELFETKVCVDKFPYLAHAKDVNGLRILISVINHTEAIVLDGSPDYLFGERVIISEFHLTPLPVGSTVTLTQN